MAPDEIEELALIAISRLQRVALELRSYDEESAKEAVASVAQFQQQFKEQ